MKFNLAISLLVHVVIFAFLNIHKNEKSSDELISSVSVISQNYYDALISRKPDINHNLIQTNTCMVIQQTNVNVFHHYLYLNTSYILIVRFFLTYIIKHHIYLFPFKASNLYYLCINLIFY